MTSAACKISVSQGRGIVNTRPVTEITPARERAEARMGVILDRTLSAGAKVLYVLLDDYGRYRGEAFPHQETLAERLGLSECQVRRQLRELEDAGYVRSVRGQRGVRYFLEWSDRASMRGPTEQKCAVGVLGTLTEALEAEASATW